MTLNDVVNSGENLNNAFEDRSGVKVRNSEKKKYEKEDSQDYSFKVDSSNRLDEKINTSSLDDLSSSVKRMLNSELSLNDYAPIPNVDFINLDSDLNIDLDSDMDFSFDYSSAQKNINEIKDVQEIFFGRDKKTITVTEESIFSKFFSKIKDYLSSEKKIDLPKKNGLIDDMKKLYFELKNKLPEYQENYAYAISSKKLVFQYVEEKKEEERELRSAVQKFGFQINKLESDIQSIVSVLETSTTELTIEEEESLSFLLRDLTTRKNELVSGENKMILHSNHLSSYIDERVQELKELDGILTQYESTLIPLKEELGHLKSQIQVEPYFAKVAVSTAKMTKDVGEVIGLEKTFSNYKDFRYNSIVNLSDRHILLRDHRDSETERISKRIDDYDKKNSQRVNLEKERFNKRRRVN